MAGASAWALLGPADLPACWGSVAAPAHMKLCLGLCCCPCAFTICCQLQAQHIPPDIFV